MDISRREPYIFKSCGAECSRMCHDHTDSEMEYARAYIRPTTFSNYSMPREALMRGTMFDVLYMPFCVCARKEKCHEE